LQYDWSGSKIKQVKIAGLVPQISINKNIIEDDWIGSLDSWNNIESILVLADSQKLLIQFNSGGVIFIDLEKLVKEGFNFYCDISNIGFEYGKAKMLIAKIGGSPTAFILSLN
jgi:hypothetical protein